MCGMLLSSTPTTCVCVGARSVTLSTDDYHVHEVATVLKRFLRTLSDPLLTSSLYDRWIAASRMWNIVSISYYDMMYCLTSLVVTPSMTRGRGMMQKTVTPSLTRGVYSETDGHSRGDYSRVALRGVSRKLTIRGGVSVSHAASLHCHVDIIDTTSCSNRCMLTLYCLVAHSVVINRRPTMRVTDTGK